MKGYSKSGSAWGRKFLRDVRSLVRCAYLDSKYPIFAGECKGRIEFAHIKLTSLTPNGYGRGLNARALDIFHHPDAYIPLCAKHHLMRDGKNARTERKRLGRLAGKRKLGL